jgi:hypothetical protein
MPQRPENCPRCDSKRVADILYGLPDFSDELVRKLDAGEIVLGGCTIFEGDPTWHCVACGHRWGEQELPGRWEEGGRERDRMP